MSSTVRDTLLSFQILRSSLRPPRFFFSVTFLSLIMVAFVNWIVLFILCVGEIITTSVDKFESSREKCESTKRITIDGKRISHLDLLIEDLVNQQWRTDEIACQRKVLDLLENVKNSTLWASWIWDSMQSPTGVFYGSRYQFGNYDQCLKAPWLETHSEYRTKYCLAEVKLSNEEPQDIIVEPHTTVKSYVNSISKHGVTFNTITWGVCVPVECNSGAVAKVVRSLYKHTHLGLTVPIAEVSIDPCHVAGSKTEHSVVFYLIMFVLAFVIIAAVTCTTLNVYYENDLQVDSVGTRLIKALCMKENMAYLFKDYEGDIPSIHGIRCITASIVVGLHVWFVNNWVGTINYLDVDKDTEKYNLTALAHAELVVDTYLMLSGLLLIKSLMSSPKHFNPFLIILKRYLRFVWILVLVLLFLVHLLAPNCDGPLWPRYAQEEAKHCRKTWWLTLFMLGNYVDTANTCYPILWTVPCDFHLSMVGVILIWLLKRNRRAAFASFTVLAFAAIIMPGVVTYQQRLPAVPPFNIRSIKDYRNNLFKNPTYLWSHLRAGPYLVGLALGYLMSIYKLDKHRNIIPKTYSLIGFIAALVIAMQMMVMGGAFQDRHRPYNVWESALFAAFNRTIWAIAIACLIVFCEYGTVPVIGPLLKLGIFSPFSKLAYGTYLFHTLMFSRTVMPTRTPLNHDMYLVFIHTFGVLVICNINSLFLYIFFEAPMSKIINILFDSKRKKNDCKVNEHEYNNNVQAGQKKTL